MRVRLWLKSTRISVATCQKERIVRRYFSLHWGAGACPAKKRGIATTKHSVSCNNQTKPDKREFESALHPCVLKSTVHTHANKAKHDTVHYAYQIQLDTHQKVLQLVDIKPKN